MPLDNLPAEQPALHPGQTFNDIAATLDHLCTHFLTLEQLAGKCALTPGRVLELIAAGCAPPHSHSIVLEIGITTALWGHKPQKADACYYSPSLVAWINDAERLARDMPLAMVALEVRTRFDNELRTALLSVVGAKEANPECFDDQGALLDAPFAAWANIRFGYLMDGTFGICLKKVSAQNIVRKGVAVSVLTRYLNSAEGSVSDQEVKRALSEYKAVAALFLPSERPGSSRVKVFEAARQQFLVR